MSQATSALQSSTPQSQSAEPDHPQYKTGKAQFDAIASYLTQNNIGYKVEEANKPYRYGHLSVTNKGGKSVFIQFDFSQATAFGRNMEYSVGVTKTNDTPCCIVGDDGKTLLMTTNRGKNGFEDRFTTFMRDFTGRRDLPSLKLP